MASVEGSLSRVGVPELFRAIAREGRTGSLTLTRSGAEARVFFRNGDAYHARSVGSGVQLGARLISAGAITNDDLNDALAIQKSEGGGRRLGQILVDQRLVSSEDLQRIVSQQIEDTIFEILRWDGGDFRFDQDVRTDEDIGLQVSVENLVMEGARRFREWHQITRRVPTLDAIPIFNENSAEIDVALTPEEWAFVSRVDGKATIKELGVGCGFTDLEAGRTVFGLVTAGLLDIELPAGVELPLDDADLDEVFDELERALQEASIPREAEQGAQPTLEELVIGRAPAETLAPIIEEVPVEQSFDIAEADGGLPNLDEVPEIDHARRDPAFEADLALSSEVPSTQDRSTTDAWPKPVPEAAVPSGQEWEELESDAQESQTIPTGHDLVGPPILEAIAEPELPVSEQVAEPELPVFEQVAEVIEEPPVDESETVAANGSHSETAPVSSESWGDLRVQAAVEHPEVEPVASWLDAQILEDARQREAVEVSAAVIVEEPVDVQDSQAMTGNSLARLFAELSSPRSDQPVGAPEAAPVPAAVEPEAANRESADGPTPRPVDPSVDTTALLREFSGLGLKDEQASPDWGQMESPRRSAPADADKGRGLFGKKKR